MESIGRTIVDRVRIPAFCRSIRREGFGGMVEGRRRSNGGGFRYDDMDTAYPSLDIGRFTLRYVITKSSQDSLLWDVELDLKCDPHPNLDILVDSFPGRDHEIYKPDGVTPASYWANLPAHLEPPRAVQAAEVLCRELGRVIDDPAVGEGAEAKEVLVRLRGADKKLTEGTRLAADVRRMVSVCKAVYEAQVGRLRADERVIAAVALLAEASERHD